MDIIKKNIQIVGYVGCALALIGCFLPFVTVSLFGYSQSVKFTDGDGIFVIIAAIAAAVLIFFKKKWFVLIPNAIALIVTIYDGVNGVNESLGMGKLSIGFYVILIGIIVSSLFSFIYKEEK